jgi:hypothetical protein
VEGTPEIAELRAASNELMQQLDRVDPATMSPETAGRVSQNLQLLSELNAAHPEADLNAGGRLAGQVERMTQGVQAIASRPETLTGDRGPWNRTSLISAVEGLSAAARTLGLRNQAAALLNVADRLGTSLITERGGRVPAEQLLQIARTLDNLKALGADPARVADLAGRVGQGLLAVRNELVQQYQNALANGASAEQAGKDVMGQVDLLAKAAELILPLLEPGQADLITSLRGISGTLGIELTQVGLQFRPAAVTIPQ